LLKGAIILAPTIALTPENEKRQNTLILLLSAALFGAIYLFLNFLFGAHEVSEIVARGKKMIARIKKGPSLEGEKRWNKISHMICRSHNFACGVFGNAKFQSHG
jgi:hypothetical protein